MCAYSGKIDTVNDLLLSHKGALNASNHVSNCKGNLHFSLSGVQHYLSGSSIKMSEEAACVGTFYGNCVHKRDFPLVLQGKVAAHKLVVVGNTICFVANFLKHVTAKIMKIGSRINTKLL